MSGLNEYKCPSCGGALHFDSASQKMKCAYCGTEIEVSALEALDAQLSEDRPDEMNWQENGGSDWNEGTEPDLQVCLCESCGGEIMADENTVATSCPFCGNPVVLTSHVSGTLKPDYVIPFKLDKEAAKAAYRNHLKGKMMLPRVFAEENHIDEIKGIYVPFWIYDADVDAAFRYNATRTTVWNTPQYTYTRTSHYSVFRKADVGFSHVPVDGSSKMPDDLMEAIEPFDFHEAVDFQTAFLSGYLADKYDVDCETNNARANERIRRSTEELMNGTVIGYQTVVPAAGSVQLRNGSSKYALYPVWLLNTTWKGKRYTFAMNGQTGKMVGDLPADTGKLVTWQAGLTAAFTAVTALIIYLFFL